jgi:AcrR family transcriptional regulator
MSTNSIDLNRRHRDNTRERLIRAGRDLFFRLDHGKISVDLIAREAGFSRAAFYLHFADKDDLLAAMMLAESYRADTLFRWFEANPVSADSIARFLAAFIDANAATPAMRLFHVTALQSPRAHDAFMENRRRLMAVLGQGFPAFRPAHDDSSAEQARMARATLAMVLIEQCALREYRAADAGVAQAMLAQVSTTLLGLHRDYPGNEETP